MAKVNRNAKENEPMTDGRYGVIYRQRSVVRRFVADYSVTEGWLLGLPDVKILAWWDLPDIPDWIVREQTEVEV